MRHRLWRAMGLAATLAGFGVFMPLAGVAAAATSNTAAVTPGFNIITSPLPIKLSTTPSATIQQALRLKNQGDQPEGIKVGLMKFAATGTTGTPDLFNLSPSDTYASWVHFSPQQFVAQPGVWDTVNMTINVPSSASLGYYLAVTFSPANVPGASGSANLKGEVATLVLLDVRTPNEKRSLELVDFSTDHGLYEYLPVNFSVKFFNSGNIYLAPAGDVFIQRGNKAIDDIPFNPDGGSVLPQSNRDFSLGWSNGFPVYREKLVNGKPVTDGHDQPELTLHWDFAQAGKFRFGHYTAKLVAAYDNGSQDVPLEATVGFWVLPWKLMLLVLVIIAVIGFGLFSFGRSAFRKTRAGIGKLKSHHD